MPDLLPDFALMIQMPYDTGFSSDEFFRCFSCIENLCDFIEDELIVRSALDDYDSLSTGGWKRLKKQSMAVMEKVRRGWQLGSSDRKQLNSIMTPLIFKIRWWGKFSFLLRSDRSPAIAARRYYYEATWEQDTDWDSDTDAPDPIDWPPIIPQARADDFFAVLQNQISDELQF
jgi:hypothetical protein